MKRIGLSILLLLSLLVSVMSAAAQEGSDAPPDERRLPGEVLDIIAAATGLTPEEILSQAREDDLTLAEIIENAGGDVAAVQAEITSAMTDAINERHATALENVDQRVDDLLNTPLPDRGDRLRDRLENRQERRELRLLLRATVDALDTTPREFMDAWGDDQTLADAITAQGGDPNAIKAAALELVQARLDRAVDNERISAEEAAERLAAAEAALEMLLSQTRPPRLG